jgi:hypothetical protein
MPQDGSFRRELPGKTLRKTDNFVENWAIE